MPDPGTPEQPGSPSRPGGDSVADQLWWYRDVRQLPVISSRASWRRARRRLALDAVACLSLSTLCFSQARSETLFLAHWGFYNRVPLGPPTLLALVANVVGLAAAGFLVTQALRRAARPAWCRLAAATAAAALLIALNFARPGHPAVGDWTDAIGHPVLLALAAVALAASLGWPRPALRAVRGIALLATPLAVATLAQALWMFLEVAAGPVWRRVDPTPLTRAAPSLRRVVWLVFEEFDQRIVFEARPAGLELPELDRLRREALYADAARPPAETTEVSIAALITGRPVVAVAPVSPHDLELTFADGRTARLGAQANAFSRARVLGYDTALIGWHLPYPRVLGSALGVADWRPSAAHEQARGDTFGQAFRNQWASLAPPANVRRLTAQRVAELGDLAIRTAADGRFGLVLLHLPIPRPPGIYDAAAGRLTTWNFTGTGGGYLDNLALADRVVGELRRGLDRSGVGDRTWTVVTSAQSWRASKRYDGQVDHRVPFLVRPPSGGRAVYVEVAFNTLATHDLVLAILRGSISDTADAASWLERQAMAPPKDYTIHGRPVY